MKQFNFAGICLIPPNPNVHASTTMLPRSTGRMDLTSVFDGTCVVDNLWGIRAKHGAHLFMVLTRDAKRNRYGNIEYGQLCFKFWANPHEKNLEGCDMIDYIDSSGTPQLAHVWYIGEVQDVYGKPPSDAELRVMWGLDSTPEEAFDVCRRYRQLRIVLAPVQLIM